MLIQEFNADSAYQQALVTRVRTVCNAKKELSLQQIILELEGAYPTDVCAVLQSLGLTYQQESSLTPKSTDHSPSLADTTHLLFADPHPADYDWRFDSATIQQLAEQLHIDCPIGEKGIALLGAKTVFPSLYLPTRRLTLFDKNQAILQDLRNAGYPEKDLVDCDLCMPLTPGNYQGYAVALADPPWYLEYYQAFMRRASEILHLGGKLYLSVLPALTRPSAIADRAEILHYGAELGFSLLYQGPGALSYQTPAFERQALNTQGLSGENWRRGDLWVWRKDGEPDTDLTPPSPIIEPQWAVFRVGRQQIKIKKTVTLAKEEFTFEPADIVRGSILSQVSRRSAVRSRIVVWSSDNQAYYATRPALVERCLAAWSRYGSLDALARFLHSQPDVTAGEHASVIALLKELIR